MLNFLLTIHMIELWYCLKCRFAWLSFWEQQHGYVLDWWWICYFGFTPYPLLKNLSQSVMSAKCVRISAVCLLWIGVRLKLWCVDGSLVKVIDTFWKRWFAAEKMAILCCCMFQVCRFLLHLTQYIKLSSIPLCEAKLLNLCTLERYLFD